MIHIKVPLQSVGKEGVDLFQFLHDRDELTFKKYCSEKENKNHVNENDGTYTYLQYACMYGLLGAVEALLDNGANPNLTCRKGQSSPIMIAAREGYFEVVELLAKQDNIIFECTSEGTVLHAVLDGLTKAHETLAYSFDMKRHLKCLEYLMDKVKAGTLDINAQNEKDLTVLHLAVKLQDKRIIRMILDRDPYIGAQCKDKHMAISKIDAKIFKEYLDNCVLTNNKLPIDDSYEIIYKYNFLMKPQRHDRKLNVSGEPEGRDDNAKVYFAETEPLIELSQVSELRHLLNHPVLSSFLNLKWYTIRIYFWVNLIFYVTFWLCLTLHTLFVYAPSFDFETNKLDIQERRNTTKAICTWYPSIVLCVLLFLRELFQFAVLPSGYVKHVENLLDVALLVFNILILCCKVNAQYAAVSVLLTWTELVLLISRHPSLATHLAMYRLVCKSFLKVLAWSSSMIVAFALSFYLMFKDAKDDPSSCTLSGNTTYDASDNVIKFFGSPYIAFFKVILMMTGELETSSLPLDCHPGVSHMLFVLFVVLVVIALFNLMNGLAVSDTQKIRSDAEVIGYVVRANLIAYVEQMVFANPFASLDIFLSCRRGSCCTSPMPLKMGRPSTRRGSMVAFYEGSDLFPHSLSKLKAYVRPNEHNSVVLSDSDVNLRTPAKLHTKNLWWILGCPNYTDWYMSNDIMNAAKQILVQRRNREEQSIEKWPEEYGHKLEEYGGRLTVLEQTTKEKLNEVIELLKNKRFNTLTTHTS